MHTPISTAAAPIDTALYIAAMKHLVGVVQKLSLTRSINGVTAIVRDAARELTAADGATFVLRDGEQCYYADENAIAPLWKGKRFPMSACVSGWVMQYGRPAVIDDIFADPRVPADAYRSTFVKSLAMVPIRTSSPIGAIGNYWASRHRASDEQVALLAALADTTSVAIENAGLYERMRAQVEMLSEQQTQLRDQCDALGVFTRAMAHDLKEPVRSLKSFSRLLLDPSVPPDDAAQYLGFVRDAADRMGVLLESVLRYMQTQEPTAVEPEPCSITNVVETARKSLESLAQERGAIIECGPLPTVLAHPAQVVEVMQNLIRNAIQHNDRPVTVSITALERDDCWLISVSDNGVGVPDEHAQRIFLPFKRLTNQQEGAGLGLAICEKLIRRCGGSIWHESQGGPGTTICFTLPKVTFSAPTAPAAPECPENQDTPGEKNDESLAVLLVVDDRADDLTLSKLMLQRRAALRCRMLTAKGGEEALEILRRESVDLMLLDINMPGLDGFEVLEHVRQNPPPKLPAVIMCTGSDSAQDRERSELLGAAGYLLKPPTFDALRPLLERIPSLRLTPRATGTALERADNAAG